MGGNEFTLEQARTGKVPEKGTTTCGGKHKKCRASPPGMSGGSDEKGPQAGAGVGKNGDTHHQKGSKGPNQGNFVGARKKLTNDLLTPEIIQDSV